MSNLDPVNLMLSNGFDFWQRKYYVGNSTFGTAIQLGAHDTIAVATEGCLTIVNTASSTGSTNRNTIISPLYIKLIPTVADGATSLFFEANTDVVDRYSTGGTQITMASTFVDSDTANNARPTAVSEVYFGDLTLAAATSEAKAGVVQVRPAGSVAGTVVGDEILITFGGYRNSSGGMSSTVSATTGLNNARGMIKSLPPVFIGTGCSWYLQPFGAAGSATTAAFEVEVGVVELWHDPKRA
ncbi:hypothetical protein HOD41_07385 [bacterium]|jgi:hypothetical protein|nr:hypothetical protein [bacterium]